MKWFQERGSALLITPKVLLFQNHKTCIPLSSLKELISYNLVSLDVFIDGFVQSFISGVMPLVGVLDRRSAVDYKLARDFKKSSLSGATFVKKGQSLIYHGFGFDHHPTLLEYLKEIHELQLPVVSVQSLVFSCASTLLPSCISQSDTQSFVWISPYLESGYRLVFYHGNEIKFTRIIHNDNQDQAASNKDLIQTLTYIQNEYEIRTKDIKIFPSFFDEEAVSALKQRFQSAQGYKWDIQSIASRCGHTFEAERYAMEAWLILYIQSSKKFRKRLSTQSLLTPLAQKTKLIHKLVFSLQAICLIFGLLIADGAFNLWRVKSQLYLIQCMVQTQEAQIYKIKQHLKMPTHIEVAKFYTYLTIEKNLAFEQDPFSLIAAVAEQLTPNILVREILWQREPKTTLKLSLQCSDRPEEDKLEILNEFKNNFLESLKRKSNANVSIHQPSTEMLEVNLS